MEVYRRSVFRQIIAFLYRGPIRLRIRKIALYSNQDDGTLIIHSYKRLFGSLWIYTKEVLNGQKN